MTGISESSGNKPGRDRSQRPVRAEERCLKLDEDSLYKCTFHNNRNGSGCAGNECRGDKFVNITETLILEERTWNTRCLLRPLTIPDHHQIQHVVKDTKEISKYGTNCPCYGKETPCISIDEHRELRGKSGTISENKSPYTSTMKQTMSRIFLFLSLAFTYFVVISFVLVYPDQTYEDDNGDSVSNINNSLLQSTKLSYPGFQPPYLSQTIHSCEEITLSVSSITRRKLEIYCDKDSVWTNLTTVRSNSEPFSFDSADPCIEKYIQKRCYDGLPVPNVVHYVWFNKHSLDVYSYFSIISVYKKIRPCLILVHADYLPYGPYWNHVITLVPNIIHVQTTAPSRIFGRKLGYVQHKADISRIQVLKRHGGIYFDVDQIALKSFDGFRKHRFVMSHEMDQNLGNAVIVSEKNAPFLDIWYRNYKSYDPKLWGHHSTFLPLELARKYPHLIHVENKTFFTPDLSGISQLYDGHFDWTTKPTVHLYVRWTKLYHTLDKFRTMNTSLGEIARLILYDSPDLCLS